MELPAWCEDRAMPLRHTYQGVPRHINPMRCFMEKNGESVLDQICLAVACPDS